MDSQSPSSYSQASQDCEFTPLLSQYSQSPYSPSLGRGSFPISPFGGSPFGFRPFHPPIRPATQHIAKRSPFPSPPQADTTTITMEGDTSKGINGDEGRLPKLPAKRRIQAVTSEVVPVMNTTSHGGKGRKKNQASMASPDEGIKDKKGRENWKDAWVVQRIHIRGTMHDDFGKPPKQGVDLWSKVATQLASLFPECDKDGKACRKKWGCVYDAYKKDKAQNSISGNDRRITCDWYDIVDEYMHNRANVVSESHASALGDSKNIDQQDSVSPSQAHAREDVGEGASSAAKERVLGPARDQRQRKDKKIEDSLVDMANTAKIMAAQQKESEAARKAEQAEKLKLLASLNNAFVGFLDVLKNFKKD